MGTPAQANGCIGFTNETTAQFAYKFITEWVDKANNGKFEKGSPDDGDYEIYDVDLVNSNVEFNAFSGRTANLEWQMESFREFCKTLPDCLSFQADVMVRGDSICWQKEFDNPM
jgi:hypothetical protein